MPQPPRCALCGRVAKPQHRPLCVDACFRSVGPRAVRRLLALDPDLRPRDAGDAGATSAAGTSATSATSSTSATRATHLCSKGGRRCYQRVHDAVSAVRLLDATARRARV